MNPENRSGRKATACANTPNQIIGLVLAGGQSTRMGGVDKKTLKYKGVSLLDHARQMLAEVVPTVFVSADIDGANAIKDIIPLRGPLGGLYSALETLSLRDNEWMLVLAVDMPLLTSDCIATLKRHIHTCDEHTEVIHYSNAVFPFAIRVSPHLRACVSQKIKNDSGVEKVSLKSLFQELRVAYVIKRDQPTIFENINTQQEFMRLTENEY